VIRSLPLLLTFGNLLAGLLAIVLAVEGNVFPAAGLVLVGAVLDAYDGRLARKLGVNGPFGKWADMGADLVSFGIVPSVLLYTLNGPGFGWLFAVFYGCTILARLIRFVVKPPPSGTFIGLPSPSAGIAVAAATVFADATGTNGVAWGAAILWGGLAVSYLPYPSLFHPSLWILPKVLSFLLWGGHLLALWFWPSQTVLSFFGFYTLLGPILYTRWRRQQDRVSSGSESAEGGGTA
jgi:CDP-diacylglycerol--serine O-phosphatidyltransferase